MQKKEIFAIFFHELTSVFSGSINTTTFQIIMNQTDPQQTIVCILLKDVGIANKADLLLNGIGHLMH